MRPAPPDALAEEESETAAPIIPGKPVEILAVNPDATGLRLILAACAILKRMGASFHLEISGQGGLGWRLRAWQAGISKQVSFQRHTPMDGMGELYRNADIFIVAPSPAQEFALPEEVCAAMAHGLAVAVSGLTPGLAEGLQPMDNCLASPLGDAAALAENLSTMANNRDLRHKLGLAAKASLRKLLADDDGNRIADLVVQAAALADRSIALQSQGQAGDK